MKAFLASLLVLSLTAACGQNSGGTGGPSDPRTPVEPLVLNDMGSSVGAVSQFISQRAPKQSKMAFNHFINSNNKTSSEVNQKLQALNDATQNADDCKIVITEGQAIQTGAGEPVLPFTMVMSGDKCAVEMFFKLSGIVDGNQENMKITMKYELTFNIRADDLQKQTGLKKMNMGGDVAIDSKILGPQNQPTGIIMDSNGNIQFGGTSTSGETFNLTTQIKMKVNFKFPQDGGASFPIPDVSTAEIHQLKVGQQVTVLSRTMTTDTETGKPIFVCAINDVADEGCKNYDAAVGSIQFPGMNNGGETSGPPSDLNVNCKVNLYPGMTEAVLYQQISTFGNNLPQTFYTVSSISSDATQTVGTPLGFLDVKIDFQSESAVLTVSQEEQNSPIITRELSYGDETIVVSSIGKTAIGMQCKVLQ